jgi:hypothetical protein
VQRPAGHPISIMSQHYVMVSKPACLPLKIGQHHNDNNNNHSGSVQVRDELIQIYQEYADSYPNPKLIQDFLASGTCSIYLSTEQLRYNKKKKKEKKLGGFFSFLFPSGMQHAAATTGIFLPGPIQ